MGERKQGFQGLITPCGNDLPPIDHPVTRILLGDGGGDLAVPDPRAAAQPPSAGELGQDVRGEGVVDVGASDQLHPRLEPGAGASVSMSYRITGDPAPPDAASGSTMVSA